MDYQLAFVVLAAVLAGLYTGRVFLRQFKQPDDEPRGCASCPAAKVAKQAGSKEQA